MLGRRGGRHERRHLPGEEPRSALVVADLPDRGGWVARLRCLPVPARALRGLRRSGDQVGRGDEGRAVRDLRRRGLARALRGRRVGGERPVRAPGVRRCPRLLRHARRPDDPGVGVPALAGAFDRQQGAQADRRGLRVLPRLRLGGPGAVGPGRRVDPRRVRPPRSAPAPVAPTPPRRAHLVEARTRVLEPDLPRVGDPRPVPLLGPAPLARAMPGMSDRAPALLGRERRSRRR